MWEDAKIVIATPHVIRNDARNGRILLSDIDLLIVDEAHHATGLEFCSTVRRHVSRSFQ